MKSITRLFLSKHKQKVLSAVRRINDIRNDLAIDSRFKQSGNDDRYALRELALEEIIADSQWNNLRVTCIAPWKDGDELTCIAAAAYGKKCTCRTLVIAKRPLTEHGKAIQDDERIPTRLLVTIRIPKRITSYAISLAHAAHPECKSDFVLRESDYGRMLHENGMLVLSAEYDSSYPEWFHRHKASEAALSEQRSSVLAYSPIFSIIVPLYKTPIGYFNDMVQSVLAQSYPYWQLVLVNASSEIAELNEAVDMLAESDERITVVTLPKNLGITLNTNEGMKAAIGDFVSFFDHDDTLEPDILFEYAKAINEHPASDVLYCDEDKLTPEGEYMHPFFKPDYSPDLLHCHNYICHMLTVRASILAELEPADAEMDGSQDYNCVLRCAERARYIHHVRKVLYHWRISPTSAANDTGNKPYATHAGKIALERHFERLGIDARIELRDTPARYNAIYHVDAGELVSIIIPSCDDYRFLEMCVSSIAHKTRYANYEVIIVDCGTTEARTLAYYEALSSRGDMFNVLRIPDAADAGSQQPANALAYGASQAHGDYLVFLSHDVCVVTPDWLSIMLGYFQLEATGCVGARMLCDDGTIFHAGIAIGGNNVHYLNQDSTMSMLSYFGLRDDVQNVSAVSPSCMMTRKDHFIGLGGFEPVYTSEYQGIDYCLRLREAGKRIVYTPLVEAYRHEPYPEFGHDDAAHVAQMTRNIARFKRRWAAYYANGDPYYSVNFQQLGKESRFYHLERDYGLTVVLKRRGVEYAGYALHAEE